MKKKWHCTEHRSPSSPDRPSLPVQVRRTIAASSNELCPICLLKLKQNPIQCTSCLKFFHQDKACSGLPERYAVKRARPTWKCRSCIPNDPALPTTPTRPIPARKKQTPVHMLPNPMCLKCKAKVVLGYLTCATCRRVCHQGCSDLSTRDAKEKARENKDWDCETCRINRRPPDKPPETRDAISQKSEPKSKVSYRPLRILQWNAEGINTKVYELREFLEEYKIDVAVIQETKLLSKNKKNSPDIKGYQLYRGDRIGAENAGGGLMTVIKEGISFRKNGLRNRDGVELLGTSIHISGKKWLTLNNLYLPPNKPIDLSWIPVEQDSIFAGDFNGHARIWDNIQPTDDRGEKITDWLLEQNLFCINDGSPTRINRGTGGLSTPDITCTTEGIKNSVKWTVIHETTMGSDHSPIVCEYRPGGIQTISTTPMRSRWKSKDVDWKSFRDEVESAIPSDQSHLSLFDRITVFSDILTEAGKQHVGKTKPSKRKFAMNPKVKALVKKRNWLRKNVATKRKEWLLAEKEVREAKDEAKTEAWSAFVENLQDSDDIGKVWRTIKSLDGAPTSSAPNEALKHRGKTIVSNVAKANAFAKHYAQVSSLDFSKEERKQNLLAKKTINTTSVDNQSCSPFTMGELRHGLRRMKRKGAPGADDIPPAFLKELGPKALSELLWIFNASFNGADIPQTWRHAIVIPLLKAGKPASEIASFRPISLTSCVVKLFERMITERLYNMAEQQQWIVNQQAGFRKARCCEDQVLKLIQRISDGMQHKPAQKTVMALLDFSKAYDRTWRERLLLKLCRLGVPMQMVRWIAAFLRTRTAEVMINGTLSKRVRMKQGLPQGSVLSPLLFLLYINDIGKDIPEDTDHNLFADDASLVAMDTKLNAANKKLQAAVSAVEQWSVENKLDLNISKSCTFFFTTDKREAKWRPDVKLFGKPMNFGEGKEEKCPKFLGVILDRELAFTDHVKDVTERVADRTKLLYCLASRSWGWSKINLRKIYITKMRTIMDYAASAYQPWISKTQLEKLDNAQNRCLKAISGVYQTSNLECRRIEVDLPSYQTHSKQLIATAYEKAIRMPPGHPNRDAIDNSDVKHRLSRSSFRQEGERLCKLLSVSTAPREPIQVIFPTPWDNECHNLTVFTNEDIKTDIAAMQKRIDELKSDLVIYTDGSCTGGVSDGGAAAIITRGPFEAPITIHALEKKGHKFTCSYEEEKRAMILGLEWLTEPPEIVTFATDSLSLLQAINSRSVDTIAIRQKIRAMKDTHFNLLYVPGHKDIPGNETADQHAKAAALLPEPPVMTVPFRAAKSAIKKDICDPAPTHRITRQYFKGVKMERDVEETRSRKKGALLAQLRSGHHKELAYYAEKVDQTGTVTAECKRCDTKETDDVIHWLTKCPQGSTARQQIFGTHIVDVMELATSPHRIIRLAERTLTL